MTTVLVGHCVYFSSQICYAFNYDDEVIMVFHPELVEDTIEDDVFNSIEIYKLKEAIKKLNQKQKERLVKFFFDGKSTRTIAKEEEVAYSAVDKPIASALKNLIKFLK